MLFNNKLHNDRLGAEVNIIKSTIQSHFMYTETKFINCFNYIIKIIYLQCIVF